MYNRYIFDVDSNQVYVIGDSHGEFDLLNYKIKETNITDSIIIVAGDCGFGFEKPEYYKQVYNKLSKALLKQNVTLIFVRGNHDDPDYFDGEKINYDNFIAIPDYSVISTRQDNILCVGGGISIDRYMRKHEQNKPWVTKKCYWENEPPIYNPDILKKIKEDDIDITVVVSHTCPNFAPLLTKDGISYWLTFDNNLLEDLDKERNTMTDIYNHLIHENKNNLKTWLYGHFHQHENMVSDDNVNFIMLDMLRTRNNSWDIRAINC